MTIPNDPFGTVKPDKKESDDDVAEPRESARIHARDDVDSGLFAHHHTLGGKHNQASPGDHTHTGKDSRLIGKGAGITVTGSKGGNVALASLIDALQQVIDLTDTTT
jgi:hypothetical protein